MDLVNLANMVIPKKVLKKRKYPSGLYNLVSTKPVIPYDGNFIYENGDLVEEYDVIVDDIIDIYTDKVYKYDIIKHYNWTPNYTIEQAEILKHIFETLALSYSSHTLKNVILYKDAELGILDPLYFPTSVSYEENLQLIIDYYELSYSSLEDFIVKVDYLDEIYFMPYVLNKIDLNYIYDFDTASGLDLRLNKKLLIYEYRYNQLRQGVRSKWKRRHMG